MSLLLDPFDTAKPELIPLEVLPATAARIAITAQTDPDTLGDGAMVQSLELNAGDVILFIGQDDPAENGLYLVGTEEQGADRLLGEPVFADHIGPGEGIDGYSRQFKVAITAGTNAGKTYFLATPPPALFEDGPRFYELKTTTPRVTESNFDLTPPEVLRIADPPFDATYVCKVAISTNQELDSEEEGYLGAGPITLDGEDLENGDYYLLKGQTTTAENGVYVVSAGAPAKAQATGLVRARITAGTNAGKQFSVDQETGVVTSLAPGVID